MFSSAKNLFLNSLESVSEMGKLFQSLQSQIPSLDNSDLLRFQLVYAVSALDRLIHDLIQIGMLNIFAGNIRETDKYKNESICLENYTELSHAQNEAERYIIFKNIIVKKMQTKSFQQPEKIADGLSFFWDKSQKLEFISKTMNRDERGVRTQLNLIVTRRNAIVHEADIAFGSLNKTPIDYQDSESAQKFVHDFGMALINCVESSLTRTP